MSERPSHISGYTSETVELARATCLYVASKLGDLMDELVVVGGLVPSLLTDQMAPTAEQHAGTMDLDVGLALGLLDEGRYQALSERLRGAGFKPDRNREGNLTRQRWRLEAARGVSVDFLIPPSAAADQGGRLRDLEGDFAAIITPGLHLAFRDREVVVVGGPTIMGEEATRSIGCCGAGAYVVLKALAFGSRGENKDAYDLYYLLRNFGRGVEDVVARVEPLVEDPNTQRAIEILEQDFLNHEGLGPRRVAEFLTRGPDDQIQADVVGFVEQLLEGIARESP